MPGVILICNEIGAGEAPSEIQVIPYGYHDTPKGPFLCDEESESLVIEAFSRQANDMVVDYEHQTLGEGEAPAAGWIKELINKGKEGVWARVEWNARAQEYIKNKEYKYVSPVFWKRFDDNKVIQLINVALVNQPNIDGMVPLVNKAVFKLPNNKEERTMDKKELCKALGLPEDSSDEAIIQMVNKLKSPVVLVANKSVLDVLSLKEGATESEVVATIMAMKQGSDKYAELATKVTTLELSLKEKGAEEMVNAALKEGKITADQKEWASKYATTDPDGFKVFIAKAPVVVPMGELKKGADITDPASGIEEAQLSVNKLLGISDETFKKHNPKD